MVEYFFSENEGLCGHHIIYVIYRDLSLCGKFLRTREVFAALARLVQTPAEWKVMIDKILEVLKLTVLLTKRLVAQGR
jgi:hypothetical protein